MSEEKIGLWFNDYKMNGKCNKSIKFCLLNQWITEGWANLTNILPLILLPTM